MNKKQQPYNVIIADIQYLITESLILLLKNSMIYNLIDKTENIDELHFLLKENKYQLLITDINSFDYNGFENLKKITVKYPDLKILILTNLLNRNEIIELTKIGIKNLLYKTADKEEILTAIDATLKNKKYYSGEVLDLLMEINESRNEISEPCYLTPAEIEIVKYIADGLTTKEIAAKKYISFHTVMTHRKNIFRKLNINNASELLMYAVRSGLITNIEYYI